MLAQHPDLKSLKLLQLHRTITLGVMLLSDVAKGLYLASLIGLFQEPIKNFEFGILGFGWACLFFGGALYLQRGDKYAGSH